MKVLPWPHKYSSSYLLSILSMLPMASSNLLPLFGLSLFCPNVASSAPSLPPIYSLLLVSGLMEAEGEVLC